MHRVLVLLTLVILASRAEAAPLGASIIREQILRDGAKKTVDTLAERGEWDAVIAQMSAGKTAWIKLAPELAPGSDAGTAEDLGIALAKALPRNPEAVLFAIDQGNGSVLGWDRVCSTPFIEISNANLRKYFKQTITALSRVTESVLKQNKISCLNALKTGAAAIKLPKP